MELCAPIHASCKEFIRLFELNSDKTDMSTERLRFMPQTFVQLWVSAEIPQSSGLIPIPTFTEGPSVSVTGNNIHQPQSRHLSDTFEVPNAKCETWVSVYSMMTYLCGQITKIASGETGRGMYICVCICIRTSLPKTTKTGKHRPLKVCSYYLSIESSLTRQSAFWPTNDLLTEKSWWFILGFIYSWLMS